MTLDLSVVKRIAEQCGASTFREHWQLHPYKFSFGPSEILAFTQAIYAMGAAEQKEVDAHICERMHLETEIMMRAGNVGLRHSYPKECAQAIRLQE